MKIINKTSASSHTLSRRQLIKTGLLGTLALSTAHLAACSSHAIKNPFNNIDQSPYQFLTKDDAIMLNAILPAMMAKNWPSTHQQAQLAEAETLHRIDLFLSRLGTYNLNEIRKLFDLLQLRAARGLTTGIWSDWENASTQEVTAFLDRWKFSFFSLFNSGYNALCDILCFAWYSNPKNTQHAGYSGPPAHVVAALPQFQRTNS